MYICIILVCLCLSIVFQKYIANYTKIPKEQNKFKIILIVTILTSVLSIVAYMKMGMGIEFLLITIIILSGVVLSIVDIICYEIPQNINYIMLVVSVIIVIMNRENALPYIMGMSITGSVFLLLYVCSKGKGIGFGDVKLMFCAGLGLGIEKAILTFIVSFVTGAIIHPILMKVFDKGTKLAFGPYIAFGIILSHLYGDEIIREYVKIFMLEGL